MTIKLGVLFPIMLGSLTLAASGQTLSGTVFGNQQSPAPNAAVALRCNGNFSAQTVTSASGTYRFANLLPCEYELTAQAGTATASRMIQIAGAPENTVQDLTLGTAASPPRPIFQASGIRGLIDPGGYSAPANAAAASSLITGMAVANRARNASCSPARSLDLLAADYARSPADMVAALHYAEGLLSAQQFAAAAKVLDSVPEQGGPSLHRLRAQAAEGLGHFAVAAQEYAKINQQQPQPETFFAQGYEEILDGRPEVAASIFRAGLDTFPRNPTLLLGLGTTEFLAGRGEKAVESFLAAANSDAYDSRPYPFLAAVPGTSTATEVRVAYALDHHLLLVPTDASAHLARASVLLRKSSDSQSIADAESELRRSLALDPSLVEAHYELGILRARRGAHEDAVRELQLVVALDPARREAHYRLAQELRRIGQTHPAELEMNNFQQSRAGESGAEDNLTRYLSVVGHHNSCVQNQ